MTAPRPYRPSMPRSWWLRRSAYRRYMIRELTCVAIGAWSIWLLVGLVRLSQGPTAWRGFLEASASAPGIAFQVVVLAAAVYHAVTWFTLAPRTMPLRFAGRRVAPVWIELGHYLAAALVAAALLIVTFGY